MIGGVDVAMTRRDERDDADVLCMYFLQFWPAMVIKQLGAIFRYDERNDALPDYDLTIFKDLQTYEIYALAPTYTEGAVSVKIDFDAVSLILGENWDIGAVVAHFYKYGEHTTPLA